MLAAGVVGLGLLLAQAEPAPPGVAVAPPPPANTMAVFGRLGYRVDTDASVGPSTGISIGGSFYHRYATLGEAPAPRPELAVGLEFFHHRFSSSVDVPPAMAGELLVLRNQRTLTQTSFAAMHSFGLPLGATRLWGAAGGGGTVAYFSTPERDLRPGDASAFQPLLRGAVGLDVRLRGQMGIAVRADYTRMLTRPSFTTESGQTLSLFGDLFDIGAGLFYRF